MSSSGCGIGCVSTTGVWRSGGGAGRVEGRLINFFGFGVTEGVEDAIVRFLEGEGVGVEVGVEMGVHPAEYVRLIVLTTVVVVVVTSSTMSPKFKKRSVRERVESYSTSHYLWQHREGRQLKEWGRKCWRR